MLHFSRMGRLHPDSVDARILVKQGCLPRPFLEHETDAKP